MKIMELWDRSLADNTLIKWKFSLNKGTMRPRVPLVECSGHTSPVIFLPKVPGTNWISSAHRTDPARGHSAKQLADQSGKFSAPPKPKGMLVRPPQQEPAGGGRAPSVSSLPPTLRGWHQQTGVPTFSLPPPDLFSPCLCLALFLNSLICNFTRVLDFWLFCVWTWVWSPCLAPGHLGWGIPNSSLCPHPCWCLNAPPWFLPRARESQQCTSSRCPISSSWIHFYTTNCTKFAGHLQFTENV